MSTEEAASADKALSFSRAFFALASETKLALSNGEAQFYRYRGVRVPASGPGYRAPGGDANFSGDLRESFNVGRDVANELQPPYGPTPWPVLPGFLEASNGYAQLILRKSHRLLSCLEQALELPGGFFTPLFNKSPWLLGMVRYLPVASVPEHSKFGIAPHQDDGIFTLLHTDGSPGLQICPTWQGAGLHREAAMLDSDLEWLQVRPLSGHWLVNLGTLLSRWSNGRFRATLHRVVLDGAERFSLPFFYEANLDVQVQCLPGCRAWRPELPPPLPETTPGEILLELARRDGLELLAE